MEQNVDWVSCAECGVLTNPQTPRRSSGVSVECIPADVASGSAAQQSRSLGPVPADKSSSAAAELEDFALGAKVADLLAKKGIDVELLRAELKSSKPVSDVSEENTPVVQGRPLPSAPPASSSRMGVPQWFSSHFVTLMLLAYVLLSMCGRSQELSLLDTMSDIPVIGIPFDFVRSVAEWAKGQFIVRIKYPFMETQLRWIATMLSELGVIAACSGLFQKVLRAAAGFL